MITAGLLTAIGLVAIAAKFSPVFLRRLLYFEVPIDVLVTIGLPMFMAGTYSGIMMAIVTGLCISAVLYVTKNIIGYQTPTVSRKSGEKLISWKDSANDEKWTMEKLGIVTNKIYHSSNDLFKNFKSGWTKQEGVII